MEKVLGFIDRLNGVVKVFIGLLIGVMAIIITLQISSRFIFDFSLSWSEELARYLSIYAVFFGTAVALRSQKLIAVEILHEIIPKKVSQTLKIFVYLVCIVFFAILLVKGIEMVQQVQMQKSPALQISMAIPYAAVPGAAVLMIVNSLTVIAELFKGVRGK